MATLTGRYPLQTERLIAVGSALLFHGLVITALWLGIQVTPVILRIDQGFEMVDLPTPINEQQQTPAPLADSRPVRPEPQSKIARELEADKHIPDDVAITKTEPHKVAVVKTITHDAIKTVTKKIVAAPMPVIRKQVNKAGQDRAAINTRYTAPSSHAAYLHNPKPRYPRAARQRGMQGLVKLTVMVDVDGRPVTIDLQQSSGFSILDRQAIKTVRKWRFAPARRGNTTVTGEVLVPIHFKLDKV